MKPTGYVVVGWNLKPCLEYEGEYVMYGGLKTDKILHSEYFIKGQDWPVDPVTKKKLPIKERL